MGVKRRADGRVCKTMTDPRTGKRVYFYGSTEREVNRKIMEYQTKVTEGRTFKEVADEWWEIAEPTLAYQTVKVYKPALRRVLEAFGDVRVKDIKPRDISRFFGKLSEQGIALKTFSNTRTVLNQILSHAVVEGDAESNPSTYVPTPKGLKQTRRGAASEADEKTVAKSSETWIFPTISLYTGLRKGEILALQWKDVSFEDGLIYVTKSVAHKGDRPYIKKTKTDAGRRIVPLLDVLKNELLKIKDRNTDHYIVSDDGTKPLTNRRFQTLSEAYKRETGVSCTSHQLRHSFATTAFEAGLDAKTVQEIVGHKQVSTTLDLYTDFRIKAARAAAEKLNKKS